MKPLIQKFDIPLWYNKKEYYFFRLFKWMKANKWLNEGDILDIDGIKLNILETGGYSPGSISLYSRDLKNFEKKEYDDIIFTGDLIFRRDKGRTDINGGDEKLLCSNIKNKIFYN